MSCQLSTIAQFADIEAVARFLYPQWRDSIDYIRTDTNDDWSEDWNEAWKSSEHEESEISVVSQISSKAELSWLQDSLISFSPTADHIAIAHEDKVVFLGPKWDKQEKSEIKTKFQPLFQKSICEEERETITAIMCLPLASQKRSMEGGPDWNCVIVGFSTGYVRFYTETGISLLSQILHEEPVIKLKCRTYDRHLSSIIGDQVDELTILYPKALVCIDGFSLYHSLKACRNQVARAQASKMEVIQPPPLVYKKWGLQDQEKIIDHISCGTVVPCAFNHLQTSCMLGGFSSVIKSSLLATNCHMTVGSGPFHGFYQAFEGSSRPLLSEIATAVVSKLKSTIASATSAWFSLGGRSSDDSQEKNKPKIEQSTPLPIRCGLPDLHRQGDSISLSPNNSLAVTTDNFGRVMLIDVKRRIAIRMWKGYRDAQCGWLEVHEDPPPDVESLEHELHHSLRSALFLVIYAPRRGILEIWMTQQGPRVAAFNVSKWARLLCPGYKLLGGNGNGWQTYQCCLIEPNGTLRIITAPFHLALSDKNSNRVHDLQLLRRFKILLKENATKNEVVNIFQEIRSPNIKKQAVERLLLHKESTSLILPTCLNMIINKHESADIESVDGEYMMLENYSLFYKKLIDAYTIIDKLHAESKNIAEPLHMDVQSLAEILQMEVADLSSVMENINKFRLICDVGKVRFSEDNSLNMADFLLSFESSVTQKKEPDEQMPITLNLPEEKLLQLAKFLFRLLIQGKIPAQEVQAMIVNSNFVPEQMMNLVLINWLAVDMVRFPENYLANLHFIVKFLSSLPEIRESVCIEDGETSPWWNNVRYVLARSTNPSAALTAALVCRSIASIMASSKVVVESPQFPQIEIVNEQDWEKVSLEMEHWNRLIRQLEEILIVSMLTSSKPNSLVRRLATSVTDIEVSVEKLLACGKGGVSELIAKWAGKFGLIPSLLSDALKDDKGPKDISDLSIDDKEEMRVSNLVKIIHGHFPESLTHDVLMANCAWEYAVEWNKDCGVPDHIDTALRYLEKIVNAAFKHWIACMIWEMFVSKSLNSALTLIEKIGKSPKDRLCRKYVSMSDFALEKFVQLSRSLLEIIVQASEDAEEVPVFDIEDLWRPIDKPLPSSHFLDLASNCKMTNYGLLQHHSQLLFCLHAILNFNLKSIKPLSLFDTKGKEAFFKQLTSYPVLPKSIYMDSSIQKARMQFLTKLITSAVRRLPLPPTSDVRNTLIISNWVDSSLVLASDWSLNVDELKRHYVYELYSSGYDHLAEETLHTVKDHAVMGSQLILLVGQRLSSFVFQRHQEKLTEKLSYLTPMLTTWLKSLDLSTLRNSFTPLLSCKTIMGHVINYLPPNHSEQGMANDLVDAINSLLEWSQFQKQDSFADVDKSAMIADQLKFKKSIKSLDDDSEILISETDISKVELKNLDFPTLSLPDIAPHSSKSETDVHEVKTVPPSHNFVVEKKTSDILYSQKSSSNLSDQINSLKISDPETLEKSHILFGKKISE